MKNRRKLGILGVIVVTFILIFILNQKTLYASDDFLYHFEFIPGMASDANLQPVNGLKSILRSQYYHYHLWNGRFVAHTIVQFFMQFDKLFFNIMNTIVFLSLGWLIVKISSYITTKEIKSIHLALVYILLFLSIPDFGQTVLWISGAGNYLWMSIIYLGFYYFNVIKRKDSWKSILVAIALGFLSGATNENTGPATILMVICLAVYQLFKEKRISIWRIAGIISSSIGFGLILFAPAASKRVSERGEVSLTASSIFDNLNEILQYVLENYLIYLVLFLFLLLVLYIDRRLNERIVLNLTVLFIGFLGASFSLAAVDKVIERTMFGPVVFLITIFMIIFFEYVDYLNNPKVWMVALIPFVLLFSYVYHHAYVDIDYTYQQLEEQYAIILNNPNEHVSVPMITRPQTDYNAYGNGTNYLQENSDAWLNKWAARFFGVSSINGYQKFERLE